MLFHFSRKIIILVLTSILFFFLTYLSFAATVDILPQTDTISQAFLDTQNTGSIASPIVSTGAIIGSGTEISHSGITNSGSLTGTGSSGSIVVAPLIDYSVYSYYSGTWTQDGIMYGNSYYPNSLGLDPKSKSVEIYSYDQYSKLLDTKTKTKKQKQGMLAESESMRTMSAMSAPTIGLVAQYLLNGNADDTSGNGNNGIPTNVSWVDSERGDGTKVASFNGNDSYISLPNLGDPNEVTVSIRAKSSIPISSTLSARGLFHSDMSQNYLDNGLQIVDYNGIVSFVIGKNISGQRDILNTNTSNTEWTNSGHYLITYSKNTRAYSLYMNGVMKLSGTGTYVLPSNWFALPRLGWSYGDDFPRHYNGTISNVRIYNRVLSASEIQDLYLEGSTPPPPPITNDTNLPYYNPGFLDLSKTFLSTSGQDNHIAISNDVCKKTDAESSKTATDEKNLADPVNLATGEFTYDNTLMSIPGVGLPYQLKINYKNQATYNGPLGFNWDHNYNQYLSGETNGNVLYSNGQLGTFRFILSGSTFLRNEGLRATLVLSGGVYSINYDNGNRAIFNSINRLSNLVDLGGNTLSFTYSGSYLSGVTDTLGRTISYSYYDHNRLQTVTDFSGRKVDFVYYTGSTASGNLYDLANIILTNSGVTKIIGFEYSSGSTEPQIHNITRLIDAKGQVYVENTYTLEDRVATQKYGSASLGYTYTLSGSQITQNTVLDKLGNRTDYTYDENGNNTSIRYYNPTQSSSVLYTYTYNSLGLMTTEKRPRGNGYKYTYDTNGNLTEKRFKANADAVDSATDIVTTSSYNARNEKMTETNPNNTQIIYTRDAAGHILTETQSGRLAYTNWTASATVIQNITKTYTYFSNGLLQTMTSGSGKLTQYGYTAGQLTSLIRGSGVATSTGTFVYSPYGTILSATDGDGFTRNYAYTPFDLVSTGTTALGFVTTYAYDANNNKTRETKYISGGVVNSYFYYDSLDHLTSSVVDTALGQSVTTTYTYDNNGNVTDKKIGNGATVHYTYNEFSKPTEERILLVPGDSSKNIVTSYTYDSNNNLATKTDPRGYTTTYTYDLYDRLIGETNPQGAYVTYTYNRDNTLDTTSNYTSTGMILSKTKTLYDNFGHIIRSTRYMDPVNSTGLVEEKYLYNGDYEVMQYINESNKYATSTYDSRGNKLTTTDLLANIFGSTYNKRDLKATEYLTQNSGTGAQLMTYTYDADRRVMSSKNTQNKIQSFSYNNLNAVTRTTDEMGRVTDIERDYRGLMTKSTSYSGAISSITTYVYDERGNMTSIIDPMNRTTTYGYDGINRNTKIVYPDLKEVNMTYDKSSNLSTRTDPNGTTVTNTYDSLNRLVMRNILTGSGVGGVTSEIYTYDPLGRLITAGDNTNSGSYTGGTTNTLTFTYNPVSRLMSEKQYPNGGTGYTIGYFYTTGGKLWNLTYPDSKVESYYYDNLLRPLTISYSGQTIATYVYTGVLQNKVTYGNGMAINYSYDFLNRLTRINPNTTSMPNPAYKYNDSSDILFDGMKLYTYDGLARVIGATAITAGSVPESYTYDTTGNRTIGSLGSNTTNYTTNTLDQYTILSGSTNSGTFTYDNNGNLKTEGNRTYKYDYNNRLIEVNIGTGNLVKYTYDILGRRTKKIDSSKSTTNPESIIYVYSGDNILSEYKTYSILVNGTGTLTPITLKKNYINSIGTDGILAYDIEEQISPTGTGKTTNRYYYHTNQLGSVTALTNSTGAIMQTYSYDAFGKAYVRNGSGTGITLIPLDTYTGSTYSNSRLYTGREYDKEIGMYYLRARYYNANTGKFISRDPIGQNDQVNLYTYVANSPLKYVDRDGKKASQAIADTLNIASRLLYNSLVFLDNNSDKIIFGIGASLTSGGTAIAGFTAPACASSVSVTGGCALLASPTGPGIIVCSAPAVTAGAICGTTGVGVGMAGIGTYLMANSGKGGDGQGKNSEANSSNQDKKLGNGEINKLKKGGVDVHDYKPSSEFDLYKNKSGDIYYKRQPKYGTSEPEFIDLNINNF